jgi:hypothetical protein
LPSTRDHRRLFASIAAAAALLLVGAAPALADPPSQDIGNPGAGPLTKIAVGNDLSCQLEHAGDTRFEFFPPDTSLGDCGTFLATGGTLFAPDFANHDRTATSNLGDFTAFTPVSQTGMTGAGTSASPRKVVTVADADSTGLRITETDSYINGQESYRSEVTIRNGGSSPASGVLYRAGDCYLQNTDNGYGFSGSPNGSVGCAENANNSPRGRIEQWVPITGGNTWTEDHYSDVWSKIGSKAPFGNDCARCTDQTDNGAGLSWTFNLAPGQSVTFAHFTTFSPTGRAGPPVEGPRGNPLGLPSNKHCVDTRRFSFRLHHPKSDRIVDVRVFINGKRKMHLHARRIERLTIPKLPKRKFRVKIVATRVSGVQSISIRLYKGCRKFKPRTHGRHPHRHH